MAKTPIRESGARAEGLAEAARNAAGRGLPPVHLWDPPLSGEMDMEIRRDGTWVHEGAVIRRQGLVRVFSTILKREGDAYFLVTPVEKWAIRVVDAPFLAVDFERIGDDLVFETNVGDRVVLGPEHALRVERDAETGEPSPYIHVRGGLEALIDRKSFYRLVELGETRTHEGADWFGVASAGGFFPLVPASELDG